MLLSSVLLAVRFTVRVAPSATLLVTAESIRWVPAVPWMSKPVLLASARMKRSRPPSPVPSSLLTVAVKLPVALVFTVVTRTDSTVSASRISTGASRTGWVLPALSVYRTWPEMVTTPPGDWAWPGP